MSSVIRKVRKRDDSVQDFTPDRIGEAIRKAAEAQGLLDFEGEARRLQELVVRRLEEKGCGEERLPDVEEIQDEVEAVLRDEGYGTLSERYHEYRKRHDELRRSRSTIFDVGRMVEEFVGGRDWRSKENANLRPSISSMMFNSAGAINARYLLDKVYPPEVSDSHVDGDLHLHDLYQGVAGYCCGHSMEDILTKGLVSVGNNPYSRPPRHLDVALMQVVNYIGVMTQEWAGAQAFSWVDAYLAPFIREDGLTYKQLKQLLQMFVYNLNVTSRWGGQSPFSNVTLACGVPEPLRDKPVVVGGRPLRQNLRGVRGGDRDLRQGLPRGPAGGRRCQQALHLSHSNLRHHQRLPVGGGAEQTSSSRVTAKYGLPYFQNFVRSDLSPWLIYSMCCRLQIDLRELQRNVTGGLFGSSPKTGSVGVVTINLSRAGYLAKGSEDELFRRLRYLCLLAERALKHKREIVERNIQAGLLPYTKEYFGDLRRHFSTVGVVGGHEMCLNMGIEGGIASREGAELCRKVLEFLRGECRRLQGGDRPPVQPGGHARGGGELQACQAGQEEVREGHSHERGEGALLYQLHPAPGGLRLRPGGRPGAPGAPPDPLHGRNGLPHLPGGEPGGRRELQEPDEEGHLQDKAPLLHPHPHLLRMRRPRLLRGEHPSCPICGREADVYSRVVGYYRPVGNWNAGKQEEFRLRRKYS
jgi:anaerobic ribonucleoside-triphosphate reductase